MGVLLDWMIITRSVANFHVWGNITVTALVFLCWLHVSQMLLSMLKNMVLC